MPIVASVVSRGFTPILVIVKPFSNPQAAAESNAIMTDSQTGKPATIATATTTPLEAKTDPTDKSKPPETNAIVIPVVMITSNTRVSAIDSTLARLAKLGPGSPKTMTDPRTITTRL